MELSRRFLRNNLYDGDIIFPYQEEKLWRMVQRKGSNKEFEHEGQPVNDGMEGDSKCDEVKRNRFSRFTNEGFFKGQSPSFSSIMEVVEAVARRKCSVIITGETGVGKEMVARQIHNRSDRANKVFIPVDCTTLTGQLFESQLFGHAKGAFTGAVSDTLGFFRAANGGTIFLDEISEVPLDLQAKLLRVLQEGHITPLGSTKVYPVDVRVICATNRSLQKMVDEGKFRSDLYYRLNVITLEVPPLRERKEDILVLAEYFLENQSSFYKEPRKVFNDEVKELLVDYHWPGNVRELANAIERAYVLTTGEVIDAAVLPFEIVVSEPRADGQMLPTLDEVKRKVVISTLKFTRGRKMAAAKILGIERRQLNRLVEKYNIPTVDKDDSN